MLYRGFIEVKGKKAAEKFKGREDFRSFANVQELNGYAGVLEEDTVLIDIDDPDQSEILMRIVEDRQIDCRVVDTARGKHFLFKNRTDNGMISNCGIHKTLSLGLRADIKVGSRASYEVLKTDGEERFIEYDVWDEDEKSEETERLRAGEGEYEALPRWLCPVKTRADFVDMEAGDGRNQALFNYILTLTGEGFSQDETRETIRIINQYVLKDPLSEEELETILRDEAFQKPVFFQQKTFLHDVFGEYLISSCHIVKINGQLHTYQDGVYVPSVMPIEKVILENIRDLKDAQRREVIKYLDIRAPDRVPENENYIAFQNGVLDTRSGKMSELSPDRVFINKIPWDYEPDAYCKVTDETLNKISCNDQEVRSLLEECIGYCFHRRNELRKAFILTGEKRNGKSTFLNCVKTVLGLDNVSALDLSEVGERFSTSMMFGKLANIGDDVSDDFLAGNQVATFKKIVAGNRIKAENKGQDPYEFEPYTKLLFSANRIPRMKDRTGAVLDRMIIIPFDAVFSEEDPDYDPWIEDKLTQEDSVKYLIKLGVDALRRVMQRKGFTKSVRVDEARENYEEENNPILSFTRDRDPEEFINEDTSEVYKQYETECHESGMKPLSKIEFSRSFCKIMGITTKQKRKNGGRIRVFVYKESVTDK